MDMYLTLVSANRPNTSSKYSAFLVSLKGVLDTVVLLGNFNPHVDTEIDT